MTQHEALQNLKFHLEQAVILFGYMARGDVLLPVGKTHTDAVMELNELNAVLANWGLVTAVKVGPLYGAA